MRQLNVRNVDDKLWREVRQQALQSGISAGKQLNRILAWWQEQRNHVPRDAADRARRGRGILADLAPPGVSLVDELIAERREEFRREEEEFQRMEQESQREARP